jgi:hypothetical protein
MVPVFPFDICHWRAKITPKVGGKTEIILQGWFFQSGGKDSTGRKDFLKRKTHRRRVSKCTPAGPVPAY